MMPAPPARASIHFHPDKKAPKKKKKKNKIFHDQIHGVVGFKLEVLKQKHSPSPGGE